MNNQSPLISIIIPVYRVEERIGPCLDSVIQQTYHNWECILVDDGSPDKSGHICELYAGRDLRFKVLHKKNEGASSARNLGLKLAKGEWIAFVDSDDIISPNYLYHLYSGITDEKSLVISNYNEKFPTGPCRVLQGRKFVVEYIERHLSALSGPVSKLFSLSLIRKYEILFPSEINMGEDAIFILKYLNHIDKISIVDEFDYYIQPSIGSLSKRYYSFDSEYECFIQWRTLLLDLFRKWGAYQGKEIEMAWKDRVEQQFLRVLQCVYRCGYYPTVSLQVKELEKIKHIYINEYKQYGHPDKWRRKFNWWLVCHGFLYVFCFMGKFDVWQRR